MPERTEATVGDFFDLITGYAFKSADFMSFGVPVIKIKNVKAGYFSEHEFDYVSPMFLETRSEKIPQYDDLLISMSGNRHDGSPDTWVGKVASFRKSKTYLLNQRVGALRARKGTAISARFAGYLLASHPYQEMFIAIATSSGGQANLSPQQILGARIAVPVLAEQVQIGELLGALDDKIELNRRMNETLERMAQAIFRDWFVDFGPVRRKLVGATDPVKIMGGAFAGEVGTGSPSANATTKKLVTHDADEAARLAALFPANLADNGLPEEWEEGTLSDVAVLVSASVDPSEVDTTTPYVGLEHMPRRNVALDSWDSAAKVTSNKTRFARGHVLFGKLRPYFHKVGIAPVEGVCSTDIIVLDGRKPSLRSLVLACVSTGEFVAYADQTSTGTKMPRTSWTAMKAYPIAKAPATINDSYSAVASPLFEKIVSAIHENRSLAAMRDLLLPKLMSGEICLKDAEKIAEAAE